MRLFDGKAILRISFHDMVAVSLIEHEFIVGKQEW